MFKSEIGRTVAAIACTILFSTTCVLSAVAPAQAGATAATEMTARAQA